MTMPRRFVSLLAATSAIAACSGTLKLAKDDSPVVLSHQTITAPNLIRSLVTVVNGMTGIGVDMPYRATYTARATVIAPRFGSGAP